MADPTPDLATLDALLAAATAHRKAQAERRRKHGDEWVQAGAFVDDAAARLFVALDAVDLPALLREVRIGRAAREVLEAEEALMAAAILAEMYLEEAPDFTPERHAELLKERVVARQEYDAARARYRALLETKDA